MSFDVSPPGALFYVCSGTAAWRNDLTTVYSASSRKHLCAASSSLVQLGDSSTKVLVGETHYFVVFCFGPKGFSRSGSEEGIGEEQEERK